MNVFQGRAVLCILGSVCSAWGGSDSADSRPVESRAAREGLPLHREIPAGRPDQLTLASPDTQPFAEWIVSHGDPGARRYSTLRQIDRSNVRRLVEAWRYRSADGPGHIQANPIIVNGVLYGPTPGRAIVALDAARGVEKWRFQLEQPERLALEDAPARRGLVYWPGENGMSSRLVFAAGRWLYALDPQTGRPTAGFGDNGRVPLPTGGTAVGAIWKGHYIVPGLWGDVYSYELATGRLVWRFHTIPREGESGAETWQGSAREGAHPWGGLCLDEARGIVFVAVGAARPDFIGVDRLGDNLFSNCVVALDAATGRRLWHFQNVRHDLWDLDNPAPPNLVTVTLHGRRVDAVACVTKTGSTLLLDRVSGQPLFPFRLRRAPTSTLPGEVTAPYQPDPELPEPLSSPEVTADVFTRRNEAARAFVLAQTRNATFGWYEPPTLGRPMLYRSSRGGAEWSGAAVDVPTGRLYVSTNHLLSVATVLESDERPRARGEPPGQGEKVFLQHCSACHGPDRQGVAMVPSLIGLRHRMNQAEVHQILLAGRNGMPPMPQVQGSEREALVRFLLGKEGAAANRPPGPTTYFAVGYKFIRDHEGYPGSQPPWGRLSCLDLNTGRIQWSVPLGEYPELTAQGLPKTGTENFGGPTVTAGGLVFCAGTKDERIRAFDADTGEELWSAQLPFGGYAAPAVYEVAGRQYVVVAACGGGKPGTRSGDAYVAFALPEAKR